MTRTPQRISYQQKVAETLATAEYDELSAAQITDQHDKLRAVLKELNEEVARMLQDMHVKHRNQTPVVQRNSTELMGIRNREIENGQATLQLYRDQYSRLNRKVVNLAQRDSKEVIEKEMAQLRAKIEKLQVENKDARKQNVLRGKAISTDNLSSKIKELRESESEKLSVQVKKVKLEEDIKKVDVEMAEIKSKSNEQAAAYQQAENFFKKLEEEERLRLSAKKNEQVLQQRQALLETLKKKAELANSLHQQRYLLKLKDLQNSIANGNQCEEKARAAEAKILDNKRQIKLLEAEVARAEAAKQSELARLEKEPPLSPPKSPPKSPQQRRNRSMDVGIGSDL